MRRSSGEDGKRQLRTKVQAPKRFDDEVFKRPGSPPPPPLPPAANTHIHPSLQPKSIEFNPNLPPAAFPTRDSNQPRVVVIPDTWEPISSSSSASSSASSSHSPSPDPNTPSTHPNLNSGGDSFVPIQPRHSSPDMDKRINEDEYLRYKHPHRPMMTSEESFMKDMETSDEDEPSEKMPRGRKQTTNSTQAGIGMASNSIICPKWEELSAAHQIDLVLVLSGLDGTKEDAMKKLRLSQRQAKTMLGLIDQRNEQEAMEKVRIETLQQRVNQILLNEQTRRDKGMSQEEYRLMATEYLYNGSKGQEFYLSTAAEFAKAARYLESCGYQPCDALTHWHDEIGAQAVLRLPGAARSTKQKAGRSQKSNGLGQGVHPDTPQPSASSSAKPGSNLKRKSSLVPPARKRAYNRKNGVIKQAKVPSTS